VAVGRRDLRPTIALALVLHRVVDVAKGFWAWFGPLLAGLGPAPGVPGRGCWEEGWYLLGGTCWEVPVGRKGGTLSMVPFRWYPFDGTLSMDFIVAVNRKPWFAVEAKVAETRIDPSLRYFVERLQVPFAYQVVLRGERDFEQDGIRCLPARVFLSALV